MVDKSKNTISKGIHWSLDTTLIILAGVSIASLYF